MGGLTNARANRFGTVRLGVGLVSRSRDTQSGDSGLVTLGPQAGTDRRPVCICCIRLGFQPRDLDPHSETALYAVVYILYERLMIFDSIYFFPQVQ